MELESTTIDIGTTRPLVLVHTDDAAELGAHPVDRVRIDHDSATTTGIVKITEELVPPGILGVTEPLHHINGTVTVTLARAPESVRYIKKKLDDIELEQHEIATIVQDIHERRLSNIELSAYVSGIYTNGLSLEETKLLTEAMSDIGEQLRWDAEIVADKHSIGGVAGNCVTPILVAMLTAAGVTMPKTSSRAVTSPAGTADVMEVFCPVEFTLTEIQEIVTDTNGCLIWGGGVNLSPADDEIIRAENPLSVDPPGQLMASVLSKKQSAGSTHVLIDIPYGEGAKVESLVAARELANDFKRVGAHLGMDITCAITHGTDPVGYGIGPVLEARDVLSVLEGDGPESLRVKSIRLADLLLDHCNVDADATELLESGAALEQFYRIVEAQGGDTDITSAELTPGTHKQMVKTPESGIVTRVDNRQLCDLARRAGAPKDARAGLVIHQEAGETVQAGDKLYTIHCESAAKLDEAVAFAETLEPLRVRTQGEALVEQR